MKLATSEFRSRRRARGVATSAAAAAAIVCSLFVFAAVPAAAALPTATIKGTSMSTNALVCPTATLCLAGASSDTAAVAAVVKINAATGAAAVAGTAASTSSPVDALACSTATQCIAAAGVGDSFSVNGSNGAVGTTHYDSGNPVIYYAAVCPTASSCLVGGTSAQSSGTTHEFDTTLTAMSPTGVPGATTVGAAGSGQLDGLACVSATRCYGAVALGAGTGDVLVIDNGVVQKALPTTFDGFAITCEGAASCLMVGADSGKIYAAPVNPTTGTPGAKKLIRGMNSVSGVTCASATTCFAVGYYRTAANALTARVSDITSGVPTKATVLPGQSLAAVACPTATTCWATGENHKGTGIVDSVPVP
jgi:hypothetical protein